MPYPSGYDSFSARTDNVDTIMANDVNELQTAIAAVEAELGLDPAGSAATVVARLGHSISSAGMLEFDDSSSVTIASGAITVTQNFHKVDTEGAAATDDLDTINGGAAGMVLVLRSSNSARDITIRHNVGNVQCSGGANITLSETYEVAILIYDGGLTRWIAFRGQSGSDITGTGTLNQVAVFSASQGITSDDNLSWDGTTLNVGDGTAGRDYVINVNGETNDGVLTWMEDEDYFKFSDDVMLPDNEAVEFGTGVDMKIYYDGTAGNIDTDLVAASDLTIDCGTNKTVVLEVPVYQDVNVGALVLQTGGVLPGIVEILNSAGGATGIYTRGFAVNEEGSGVLELPHDYKEGTDIVFHVHWGGNDAPTGTDNVKWQLTYSISRGNSTFPAATTPTPADTAYDTQYKWLNTNVATITGATAGVGGTALLIGDQFNFTIKRVTATGDAYAGEALIAMMGLHYQVDTLGSRQITTK